MPTKDIQSIVALVVIVALFAALAIKRILS
jgi:hypothetical protein